MKFITCQQYIEFLRNYPPRKLMEKDFLYEAIQATKENNYDSKRIREIDKKHDKMIRNVLARKTEMASFLNDFLNMKELIQEKEIIPCDTDFVTKRYQEKHCDILYRLKSKPVYFLIEHQSTIHQQMLLRIWEYVGEIMRRESILQKTYLRKERIYPVVVPIVLYTGFQKWEVKTNFAERQYQSDNYQKYRIHLEYNLVAVQDYTFEELFRKKTLLSYIMIIEKCKTKEELIDQMDRMVKEIKGEKEIEALSEILVSIIITRIGKEKTKELLERLKEKEESGMSPLTKMLFDIERKAWRKGVREGELKGERKGEKKGEKKGEEKGKKKGKIEGELKQKLLTVKNMLYSGEQEEKIMKYLELDQKELEEIKQKLAKQKRIDYSE